MSMYRHSVSVAAAVERDGRWLAIRRRDSGRWQLPGGVVEAHESITEALRREVREETGLTVESRALSGIYKHITHGILALVFLSDLASDAAEAHVVTAETTDLRWMTLADVGRYLDPSFVFRVRHAAEMRGGERVGPAVVAHDGSGEFSEEPPGR